VKPTVLIATTSRWFPTARLAMALAGAGCLVDAVCPARHPLGRMRTVRRVYAYRGLLPLKSFAEGIANSKPDVIVPGDDLATCHLHHLYDQERKRGKSGYWICELIERSLGASESFRVVYERTAFMGLARELGIRAPKTEVIANISDLRKWVARVGLPTVLKANGTSGGEGVRVAHTLEDAERDFRTLEAPPLLARAAKRALVDQDKSLVWPSLLRHRSVVNAQTFVAGHEATSTVACWKGAVLATLHFEVVSKSSSAGPSSVVRLIENAEMSEAVEKMVRRLKLSGLHGFDFMLEAHTGDAHLIEVNPRTTQVGHLTLGPGHDLPAALAAAVTGSGIQHARKITENITIALFPQEWTRDPASPFIRSGYHDVPWEEPELVRACIQKALKQNSWKMRQNTEQAIADNRSANLPSLIKPKLNEPRHE
jgi:hypothetical protein